MRAHLVCPGVFAPKLRESVGADVQAAGLVGDV
jgi:hypothetical protein